MVCLHSGGGRGVLRPSTTPPTYRSGYPWSAEPGFGTTGEGPWSDRTHTGPSGPS